MRYWILLMAFVLCAPPARADVLENLIDFSGGTPALAAEVNANNADIETEVTDNAGDIVTNAAGIAGNVSRLANIFYVTDYTSGSSTGGIQEALNACAAASSGSVMLPPSQIVIDHASAGGDVISSTDNCDLVGHGSDANQGIGAYVNATASSIVILNSAGATGIRVTHNDIRLKGFTLYMDSPDALTIGINLDNGVTGLNEFVIDEVAIVGDTTRIGTGLALDFALKGTIKDSYISFFDDGMLVENLSNANLVSGTTIRSNNRGILWGNDACSTMAFQSNTIEGNMIGGESVLLSNCHLIDMASHWEADTIGAQSARRNLLIGGQSFRYSGHSPDFGGTLDTGMDIVRTVNFGGFGPDVVVGGRFKHGVDYTASAGRLALISSKKLDGTFTGNVTGPTSSHPTDFPTRAAIEASMVAGDLGWEEDDNILWVCEPDADGICNTVGEFINTGAGGGSFTPNSDPAVDHTGFIAAVAAAASVAANTAHAASTANPHSVTAAQAGAQSQNTHLDDLSDGTLTGSKVGTGINGTNITTGTVAEPRIDALIARDSEIASRTYQATAPTDGNPVCSTGDSIIETTSRPVVEYDCIDGATNDWEEVQ